MKIWQNFGLEMKRNEMTKDLQGLNGGREMAGAFGVVKEGGSQPLSANHLQTVISTSFWQ